MSVSSESKCLHPPLHLLFWYSAVVCHDAIRGPKLLVHGSTSGGLADPCECTLCEFEYILADSQQENEINPCLIRLDVVAW